MKDRKKYIAVAVILIVILACAFFIRINTFWLPHWRGDQSMYITLALKLEKLGLDHYNLRGIDINFLYPKKGQPVYLIFPVLTDNPKDNGFILKALGDEGIGYYDIPLFHSPPGFPYLLMLSHKFLCARGDELYAVLSAPGKNLPGELKPFVFLMQFYAVIVPLVFSLGLITLTFFFGKLLFSPRTGLYAAFLMAVNPVDILTSQKIWADDPVSFFILLSLFLFIIAIKKGAPYLVFVAGMACGLAVLLKHVGGFLLIAIWIFTALDHYIKNPKIISLPMAFFNKNFILFAAGTFAVSGFWFLKVYQVYGNPLYLPHMASVVTSDKTGWFMMLAKRPIGYLLYPVVTFCLCPPLVLALLSLRDFMIEAVNLLKKRHYDFKFILLWLVVGIFYVILGSVTKEERYMLPAYPIIAVLAGYYLERSISYAWKFGRLTIGPLFREGIVIAMLSVCAWWCITIGLKTALGQVPLFLIPF